MEIFLTKEEEKKKDDAYQENMSDNVGAKCNFFFICTTVIM